MESREKILEKIEKLLALAGNNPSENEAISAALKAQELMAKYNIELADLEGKSLKQNIVEETYMPKANCHYVRKWRYTLSQIIAKNFCFEIGQPIRFSYIYIARKRQTLNLIR